MLHKIRKSLSDRDCNYKISNIIEMDESYFGAPTKNGKRGRGSDKTAVLVGLSLDDNHHPEYLKMEIINNVKGQTLLDFAISHIEEHSIISSDGYRSYQKLAESYIHIAKEFNPEEDTEHLKWLHAMIPNAKTFIEGTFHGLNPKHLQKYPDEFYYRFNRCKFEGQGFFRLLSCCTNCCTITSSELIV